MVACRDTDVRVALALGWRWQRTRTGSHLLCPPDDGEEPSFYDPERGGLQLVPAYSSDINVWEGYVTALRKHKRLLARVSGNRAWVLVEDQPFDAATMPLALCRMVLGREERQRDDVERGSVRRGDAGIQSGAAAWAM